LRVAGYELRGARCGIALCGAFAAWVDTFVQSGFGH